MVRSRKKAPPRKRKKARPKNALERGSAPAPAPAEKASDRFEGFEPPKGWKTAGDAFDLVKSVRSIFLDYNRATRVGGHPVRRITTIHGESHGGKTAFALGLLKSFVDAGHLGGYIDAEHATPKDFLVELLGTFAELRNFLGQRPESYEEAMDATDAFLKAAGVFIENDPDFCSALLVDTINKLVPKRELKNVTKSGAEELAKGHLGRARAAQNQAWLDHLVPRLGKANCGLILIAQERPISTSNSWEDDFQIKGGGGIVYDSSILARVFKSSPVRESKEKSSPIFGFRHRVRIWKSKVSHMDGRYTDCHFHLSNGTLVPAGFDLGRDAIEVGLAMGVVKVSSSWVSWPKKGGGKRIRKNGKHAAVKFLAKEPEEYAHLFGLVTEAIDAARAAR
jgi:hypothetical protein